MSGSAFERRVESRSPEEPMRVAILVIAAGFAAASLTAQSEAFKLGRFAQSGRTFLGVVVNDTTVAEIPASAGTSLKSIIADYAKHRAMLRDLAAKARAGKGAGIHDLKSLDTLAADSGSAVDVERGRELRGTRQRDGSRRPARRPRRRSRRTLFQESGSGGRAIPVRTRTCFRSCRRRSPVMAIPSACRRDAIGSTGNASWPW